MALLSLCNVNILVPFACSVKGQGWGRHVSQVQFYRALPESIFKYSTYAAMYASLYVVIEIPSRINLAWRDFTVDIFYSKYLSLCQQFVNGRIVWATNTLTCNKIESPAHFEENMVQNCLWEGTFSKGTNMHL